MTAALKPSRSRSRTTRSAPCLVREKTITELIAGSASMVDSTLRFCLVRAITTPCLISAAVVPCGATSTCTGSFMMPRASCCDLRRHGGREQRRLPVAMRRLGDAADVVDEAHVEHAVGLVEHEPARLGEVDLAFPHQVGQPAGRGDENVDAGRHLAHLAGTRDAAEHERGRDVQALGQDADRVFDLHGEFARRRQDQRTRGLRQTLGAERDDLGQDRQAEGRRLAGARLGDGEHVAAGEMRRDRLILDRASAYRSRQRRSP